jgi:hypothetical protein
MVNGGTLTHLIVMPKVDQRECAELMLSRSRYFDAQGMIGTTLIEFAGEPSMTLELTAR